MTKFSVKNWDCKIVEKKKTWFIVSAAIILVGIIVFAIFGFNVGIDFSGGTVLSVTTGNLYNDSDYVEYREQITDVLSKHGISVEVTQKMSSDTAPGIQVRYKNEINGVESDEETMHNLTRDITHEIETAFKEIILAAKPGTTTDSFNKNLVVSVSSVGATASAELLFKAFLAIIIASALILGYVALRFEFLSGASAVIALAHDILIMCALMAVFRIQINSSFVAALITIVGYSINNTIVLFDRVRENKKSYTMRDASPTRLINTSIKETMTRSINTTITTLFTIVLLAIIGVTQIKEFALPIIFGLIAGTYSSIFIAPPLWATFKDAHNSRLKKAKKEHNSKKSKA